jgi:hypothetical protein
MYALFRGNPGRPLKFTASGRCLDDAASLATGKHIYESLLVLWLQVWLEQNDENDRISIPDFDSPSTSLVILDLFTHKALLLPIILKSIALRHASQRRSSSGAVLDPSHIIVLQQFVEMLACCLMGQALAHSNKSSTPDGNNYSLLKALESTDVIVDFFCGLAAVLHSEHMRSLLKRFFSTLRLCESEKFKENKKGLPDFEWTAQSIHRVKSSRQIRLHACEKLAVMPSFLALNFPVKYSDRNVPVISRGTSGDSNWKMQYSESKRDDSADYKFSTLQSQSDDAKRPQSGWLARLLLDETLSICAMSCEAVVAEAIAHIELCKQEEKHTGRKRSLQREDLLLFQSLAIHSVTVMYELVIRRHAMDRRYQTETCRGRIAALYAECILTHSLRSVRWLARLESTHKVRSLWMLAAVYVLQEAPEVLIRGLVRSYCDPSVC